MEIFCEHCNTVILIDRDQFGISQECPACGRPLKLPHLPDPFPPPQPEPQEPAAGDHDKGVRMLQEPASEQTRVWRKKLAAAFQAANHFAQESETTVVAGPEDAVEPELLQALDRALQPLRRLKPAAFDRYLDTLVGVGCLALFPLAFLVLGQAAVLTYRIHGQYLVLGLQVIVALLCCGMLAFRFTRTIRQLVRSRKLTVNRGELLDAGGLLCLLAAFLLFTGGLYWGLLSGAPLGTALALMAAVATGHGALLFFNPPVLNLVVAPSAELAPGELALVLAASFIRCAALVASTLVGTLPLLCLAMAWQLWQAYAATEPELGASAVSFLRGCGAALFVVILPLLAHLLQLGFRVVLDWYLVCFRVSRDLRVLGRHLVHQDTFAALANEPEVSGEKAATAGEPQ